MTVNTFLIEQNACLQSIVWAGNKTPEQIVNECNRGDWLLWLVDLFKPEAALMTPIITAMWKSIEKGAPKEVTKFMADENRDPAYLKSQYTEFNCWYLVEGFGSLQESYYRLAQKLAAFYINDDYYFCDLSLYCCNIRKHQYNAPYEATLTDIAETVKKNLGSFIISQLKTALNES